MTDHPSTYKGDDTDRPGIQWDDRAFLHLVGDGDGVLDSAKSIRSGTFAELIAQVVALPEPERQKYYIEKAGDREFHAAEIVLLSRRADFPESG
ncbi:hypothetical protein [Aurantiacibacter gilvus]|uniref:Uncharacterized protein n=1 Tax=Aurantiacibacter gilvus TaxID=3139141 RepID=A0ABU9ICF8_9SPHN